MNNVQCRDLLRAHYTGIEHEHFIAPERHYSSRNCDSHHGAAGFTCRIFAASCVKQCSERGDAMHIGLNVE